MDDIRAAAVSVVVDAFIENENKIVALLNKLQDEEAQEHRRRKRVVAVAMAMLRSKKRNNVHSGTEWKLMLAMDDPTFVQNFRITKTQFKVLQGYLEEGGLRSDHFQGLPPLPVPKKVLIFLWYMAHQYCFREISNKFNVSRSSAHRTVFRVLTIMSALGPAFVSWPTGRNEKSVSAASFERACGLEDVIGVIDSCHIRIQKPRVRGEDYKNKRNYCSILLQGIVDVEGRFINVFAGIPGKVHDARMLRSSTFFEEWQEKMGEYRLLGDAAYIGQAFPFIVSPLRGIGALTDADLRHNTDVSRGKFVVEQAFGRMKCKWRRIRDLQNTRPGTGVKIILAACYLHNFAQGASVACDEHPHGCPIEEDANE
ncbi:uncharacterized protein LOC132468777 [Gadus macrocephalus]|uniref:uncharacterized protein LOC132468777 n=1 Tax=Gadus macrocephalus TaxID=80720 RepID=UPI0028CBB859|nr:uncharacterized protein LOC132468777 [Gadus macrocephalus]